MKKKAIYTPPALAQLPMGDAGLQLCAPSAHIAHGDGSGDVTIPVGGDDEEGREGDAKENPWNYVFDPWKDLDEC